ncbi:hypothetical protein W02_36000 [Nitrospira sp. KM1]|nr:hypothetical protein [Nitrospira sp. KM1]BCA56460.1 hypothetical protein W02_36000 [Nitrospira sp. KM1]
MTAAMNNMRADVFFTASDNPAQPKQAALAVEHLMTRMSGGRIMKNVEMTVDGTMLTIRVDLSKEFGPSASGKTIIIASTEGNVTIPNREEKVGLNVYRKKS